MPPLCVKLTKDNLNRLFETQIDPATRKPWQTSAVRPRIHRLRYRQEALPEAPRRQRPRHPR